MNHLNASYKDKGQTANLSFLSGKYKKDAILKGLEKRLENSLQNESITGVNKGSKICRSHTSDLVNSNSLLTHIPL